MLGGPGLVLFFTGELLGLSFGLGLGRCRLTSGSLASGRGRLSRTLLLGLGRHGVSRHRLHLRLGRALTALWLVRHGKILLSLRKEPRGQALRRAKKDAERHSTQKCLSADLADSFAEVTPRPQNDDETEPLVSNTDVRIPRNRAPEATDGETSSRC
jgi:hypothetical protein